MPNLVTGLWRDDTRAVVLVVHDSNSPSDEEWDEYCRNIGECLKDPAGAGIALTDGGAPNAAQRERVRLQLAGRTPRSAVVSPSLLVRGVVTALRWYNPHTVAFSPANIRDAFHFLGLTSSQANELWSAVQELDRRLTRASKVVAEVSAGWQLTR
jgi:hypothetical protein